MTAVESLGMPPAWTVRANCLDTNPAIFFANNPARAKAVCADCPVTTECLSLAMDIEGDSYTHGVYGGKTGPERRALRNADAPSCPRGCGGSYGGKGAMESHLLWCGTGRTRATHGKSCRCGDDACRAAHATEERERRAAVRAAAVAV